MKKNAFLARPLELLAVIMAVGLGACGSEADPSEVGASDALRSRTFDVVVVGGGSGGTAAAIQAARLGATVALVEHTDWIGGQMTSAGVTAMDGPHNDWTNSGLYAEFDQRVRAHYAALGKSVSTCIFKAGRTCFEPSVGQRILRDMLDEAGVEVFLRRRVVSVDSVGNTVRGVRLDAGESFGSSVLVDATEYGDVIPLTPARYRIGNSVSDDIDPQTCIQALTYTAVIRKYPRAVPTALRISEPPPGYDESVRRRFATYVTVDGLGSQVAGGPLPWNWPRHNRYRGMPDSTRRGNEAAHDMSKITRTEINLANDYPGGEWDGHLAGVPLPVTYLQRPEVRRDVECKAKLLTLQFLYYVQTALGEPLWSVADDEGYDTPYNIEDNACDNIPASLKPLERLLPVIPYVRESRRIIPIDTLTAKELKRNRGAQTMVETSIAVGDYGTDLHGCQRNADLEADLNETIADKHSGVRPFQVPFETLIPEDVDGFLAAEKNIGVSRLAAGSIRLQPITMLTGQAVGVTAALATERGVQPRDLRPIDVQNVLLEAKSALALYNFTDVPRTHTFWKEVQLANLYGIFGGYSPTRFGVNDHLTRVQIAVVLARLFDLDISHPPNTASFDDVSPGHWAFAHVEAVREAGITSGCGGSKFCPSKPVTRGQLATLVGRGLGWATAEAPTAPVFTDVGPQHVFFEHIQMADQEEIMNGCGGAPRRFCPSDPATRGQAAAVAARVLLR